MRDSCPWLSHFGISPPRILAALVLASTLLAAVPARASAQSGEYVPDALFMAIFANGDALVEYDVQFTGSSGEVAVQLFGETVSDLIVTDFDDQLLVFESNGQGQVTVAPAGAEGARISYVTSSLTGKQNNIWTFALESPVGVAIRTPQDSVVTDFGDNIPTLTPVGSQTLLTFEPGAVEFSYIIGSIGTEQQADIKIRVAQTVITDAKRNYAGIVLTDAEALLQSAIAAKDNGSFADAERLASQASEQVGSTITEYNAADEAIASTDLQISQAASENRDTLQAIQLLDQANEEFATGNYTAARATAGQAVTAIGAAAQFPAEIAMAGAAAAAGGAGVYFFLFRKKGVPKPVYREQPNGGAGAQQAVQEEEEPPEEEEMETPDPLTPSVSASQLAGIPESQTDRGLLSRIVARIITEKPNLRPEDRDVLGFLAEKEGAAFESEIRTKFSLPKTTVWRLVKRLEREELVEIRKAGGQNLIKLRFEGRQP